MLLAVAAATFLSGCGGNGDDKSDADVGAVPPATAVSITIKNFKFSPDPVQVTVGQTITVINQDSAVHTATASDKTFDSKELAQGGTYTFTATKADTVNYLCDIHQYMKGQIVVS